MSRFQLLSQKDYVYTEISLIDYISNLIYVNCVYFAAGCLVKTSVLDAKSNWQFWLVRGLLVIVIVTIITFLIRETVECIVIVIASKWLSMSPLVPP